jgi:hypothetical protein
MVKIAQIAPKKFADAIIILIEELAIKSSWLSYFLRFGNIYSKLPRIM